MEGENKCPVKLKEYELTLLCYNQYNDTIIHESIEKSFSSLDSALFKIENIDEMARYDVIYNDKQIKANVVTVNFMSCPSIITRIVIGVKKQYKIIMRFLLIKRNNYIKKNIFDYKKPINIKKHIFESQRIMCRELNNLSYRDQRVLARNIKRCRALGLFGTAKRIIK